MAEQGRRSNKLKTFVIVLFILVLFFIIVLVAGSDGDSSTDRDRELVAYNEGHEKIDIENTGLGKGQIEEREEVSMSDTDYKLRAKTMDYKTLAREPNKYVGEIIKITVVISQIMPGNKLGESAYRGYDDDFNEWYINYRVPKDTPRILDTDIIIFYGEFSGLATITRALTGLDEYVPELKAKYFELVE